MTTRKALIEALRARYRGASYGDKVKILDEFAATTGYHRKHTIRLLGESGFALKAAPVERGRPVAGFSIRNRSDGERTADAASDEKSETRQPPPVRTAHHGCEELVGGQTGARGLSAAARPVGRPQFQGFVVAPPVCRQSVAFCLPRLLARWGWPAGRRGNSAKQGSKRHSLLPIRRRRWRWRQAPSWCSLINRGRCTPLPAAPAGFAGCGSGSGATTPVRRRRRSRAPWRTAVLRAYRWTLSYRFRGRI